MERLVSMSLRNVTKTYGGRRRVDAVADTHLDLRVGSTTALIGPSGCGKSTLLKMMAGLVSATTGTIRLNGEPVVRPTQRVGMMFQSATLLPWRTARDNVLLPLEVAHGGRRRMPAAAQQSADDLLEMVGLSAFQHHYVSELSGGMAQRVAICRMLISDPSILLLDEPFGALDELTREQMNVELERICRARESTCVIVTHSIPEAVLLADTVLVMSARPGRVVEEVEIDLPRPRDIGLTVTPEFGSYVSRIRTALAVGAR